MISPSKVMRGQWFILWLFQIVVLMVIFNYRNGFVWFIFSLFLWRIYQAKIPKLVYFALLCLSLTVGSWLIQSYFLQPLRGADEIDKFVVIVEPFHFQQREWGYTGIGYLQSPVKRKILIALPLNNKLDDLMCHDKKIQVAGIGELHSFLGPDNFGAFDAKRYYRSQQVVDQLKFEEIDQICQVKTPLFIQWRNRWHHYLNQIPFPEARKYIQALLFNTRSHLSEDLKGSFKKLGLMPFLALSGFHIHLLVKYLKGILYRTSLSIEVSRWLISLFLIGYGIMTAWPISLIRAIALYLGREWGSKAYTSLDYLSGIGIFFLIIRPFYLFSISFQLSFGMTTIILLINERLILQREQQRLKRIHHLAAQICLGLASFIGTAYYFFEINLGLVLWNLLMAYFLEWILLPVLFTFLCYDFSPFLIPWYRRVEQFLVFFNGQFISFAQQNQMNIIVGQLAPILLLPTIILIIKLIQHLGHKQFNFFRFLLRAAILLLLLFVPRFSLKQSVIFLNVGQGDAMLVYTPMKRFVALIDTGGRIVFKNGQVEKDTGHMERVLLPALKREGISRIDYLILSHPDFDHMGNALELIKALPVTHILVARQSLDDPGYQLINKWRKVSGETSLTGIEKGARLLEETVSLKLLAPVHQQTSTDKNDDSLVWLMETKQERFMLTGDASKQVEEAVIQEAKRRNDTLKVDTLKAGHHGSHTSTSANFLKHLNPRRAIISAGLNNRYHHPHEEVIQRLEKHRIEIFDTRINGAIRYDEYGFSWLKPQWKTSR